MKASERRALKLQKEKEKQGTGTTPAPAIPPVEEKEKNSVENSVETQKAPIEERPQNKHLKPFKPGETGNPKGRGKGVLNYKTRIDMALDQLAEEFAKTHNIKYKETIATKKRKALTGADVDIMGDVFKQYVNMARNGNLKAIDSLLDRTYGKATQPIELTGKDGDPIQYQERMAKADAETDEWVKAWVKVPKKQNDNTSNGTTKD